MNLKTVRLTGPTGEVITLGSLTGGVGYTLDSTEFDVADRAQFAAALPLVSGGVVAPGRLSFRTVSVSGLLVASTDVAVAQLARQLTFLLRDVGTDPIIINYTPESTELELRGYLSGSVQLRPVDGGPWMSYEFELDCPDPVALGPSNSGNITATLTNAGTAPTWPTITLTLSGTVTDLRVGSTTTGEYIQLDGLSAVTEVVIETRPGFELVTLDGLAGLDKLAVASTFFPLLPGGNSLYVTVLTGGGSATGVVDWRDGYLL